MTTTGSGQSRSGSGFPTHAGNEVPQVWELYVDPCNPEPGAGYLEREWRIRKLTLTELGRMPIGECPERNVASCTPDDDESKFILASWMAWRDTERG